jgi:hypothetical protein
MRGDPTVATLTEIKEWTYVLSSKDMADCGDPDSRESAGMEFLTSVRDAVVEGIEDGTFVSDGDGSSDNDNGAVHQIADNAPDVYTHTRWKEFVDLAAYLEEPEISDAWPEDLTEAAGVALYQIAERLVYAILREWREGLVQCDECGETEPAGAESPGDWHDESCSLHPSAVVVS